MTAECLSVSLQRDSVLANMLSFLIERQLISDEWWRGNYSPNISKKKYPGTVVSEDFEALGPGITDHGTSRFVVNMGIRPTGRIRVHPLYLLYTGITCLSLSNLSGIVFLYCVELDTTALMQIQRYSAHASHKWSVSSKTVECMYADDSWRGLFQSKLSKKGAVYRRTAFVKGNRAFVL